MLKSTKIIRGALLMSIGQLVTYGMSFIRNLVLARMLGKVDFALAALFSMAILLLEVSGRMSFGTQVIQSKDGDTVGFRGSAQSLMFIGGLCSAILLIGMSVPMAHLFDVPNEWWAFALLAIVPLSQGLNHLDIMRRQRELDYLPFILVDAIPQILITAAVWPLALWLKDYRVILILMVGKAVIGCTMTFAFARSPFQFAWERSHIRSLLNFGWPLLLTGLLIFGSQQADQMLIGAIFSLPVLANYALAFSLVSIPWSIFGQIMSSIMLPLMAQAQNDPEVFQRQYRNCAQIAAIAGVALLLPLIVAGEQIIRLLYGSKYSDTGTFMAILGTTAALRFMRYPPSVAAMARGDTLNQLFSNLWRVTSLPLALVVWWLDGSPAQIATCALAGEIMAIIASIVRLWRKQHVPPRECYGASLYMITMLSTGTAFALLAGANLSLRTATLIAIGAFSAAITIAWIVFPEVRTYLVTIVRQKKARRSVI